MYHLFAVTYLKTSTHHKTKRSPAWRSCYNISFLSRELRIPLWDIKTDHSDETCVTLGAGTIKDLNALIIVYLTSIARLINVFISSNF